jgi:hypothetical protein
LYIIELKKLRFKAKGDSEWKLFYSVFAEGARRAAKRTRCMKSKNRQAKGVLIASQAEGVAFIPTIRRVAAYLNANG